MKPASSFHQSVRGLRLIAIAAMLVAFVGCGGDDEEPGNDVGADDAANDASNDATANEPANDDSVRQRMVRVTLQWPGASPQEVSDALAAAVETTLLGLPHVDSITSISSAGKLDSYVVMARDSRPDEVLGRIVEELPRDQFPAEADTPSVELLPTTATMPDVSSTQVDYIVVDLDRSAIAKHAIPIGKVLSTMQEQAGGSASDMSRLPKLRAIQVTATDNRRVPFTELAEIRVEKQPSHIVTRWP